MDDTFFKDPIIFLAGPTASGKTGIAIDIAKRFNCEIIGVDSMQVYKFMDIGSAKPTKEERSSVTHHLIDYVNPDEQYDTSRFVADCCAAIKNIRSKNKIPLLAGGTGLYFRSLEFGIFDQPPIDDLIRTELREEVRENGTKDLYVQLKSVDPESAKRIHENDSYRIVRALEIYRSTGTTWSDYIASHKEVKDKNTDTKKILKVCLDRERNDLYKRINHRVDIMVELGLVDEVKKLLSMGYSEKLSSMQSLGYRHINAFLSGEWNWDKTLELLARDTRRYAKRQITWFKKDHKFKWIAPEHTNTILAEVEHFLQG